MIFNENVRRQLNRWINQNNNKIIAQSSERSARLGRHYVIQEITQVDEEIQFGRRLVGTLDMSKTTRSGQRLKNLLLNYNRSTQTILVFRDTATNVDMTIVLTYKANLPELIRATQTMRPVQVAEETV